MGTERELRLGWWLLGAAWLLLAADAAWPLGALVSAVLLALLTLVTAGCSALVVRSRRRSDETEAALGAWLFRLGIVGTAVVLLGAKWWLYASHAGAADASQWAGSSRSYGVALGLALSAGVLGSGLKLSKFFALVSDHPARLILLTFAVTGVLGALLLSLPPSMRRVHELSLLDNLFMSFSAVCVTGMSVNDVSSTYTLFGQVILCVLVQIGALGIMVLSASVALLSGQRLRVRSSAVLAEIVDADSLAHLRRVVFGIVASTLFIEAIGAVVLYYRFAAHPALFEDAGGPVAQHRALVWAAIFHAVSGFCNAGFSNLPTGLMPLVGDVSVMAPMTLLIICGGMGFPVLNELGGRAVRWVARRRRERMTLHSRICLRATGALLGVVALAYLLLEWNGAFRELGWLERVWAAIFHSAACRTAGFNVVDMGAMSAASLMLTCVAMFIGACPGSCGGGVKTTTVAVLFAGLRSELDGRPARLLDRALPAATTRKAIGVAFMSLGLLSVLLFLMLLIEEHPPLMLAVEIFSAFSTAGFSIGITPELTGLGKLLILLTMYIGRVGPLTLALALSSRTAAVPVQLPNERVLIG